MIEDGHNLVSLGPGDHAIYIDYRPDNKHLNESQKRIHHASLPKSDVPGGAKIWKTI